MGKKEKKSEEAPVPNTKSETSLPDGKTKVPGVPVAMSVPTFQIETFDNAKLERKASKEILNNWLPNRPKPDDVVDVVQPSSKKKLLPSKFVQFKGALAEKFGIMKKNPGAADALKSPRGPSVGDGLPRATCIAHFPKHVQEKIKKSRFPESKFLEHWDWTLNIVSFSTGYRCHNSAKARRKILNQTKGKDFRDSTDGLLAEDGGEVHFQLKEQYGKGGFGTVYSAIDDRTGSLVAVKKLPHVHRIDREQNLAELGFLNKCKGHPNILQLYSAHLVKDSEVWMVTELLEGGTLEDAVTRFNFSDDIIAYISFDILQALIFLHERGIVHRDLKSANIMMTLEGKVKLIDFGLCRDVGFDPPKPACSMVGSPFWMPPEMIRYDFHSYPADIWSFAISVIEMADRNPPNCESSVKAMFLTVTEGVNVDVYNKMSPELKEFLRRCLQNDPELRPSAKALSEDPFLSCKCTEARFQKCIVEMFGASATSDAPQ